MMYWLVVAAYAVAAVASRAAPGRWRWPALGVIAAAGVFSLLPVTCITTSMYMCNETLDCYLSGPRCSTWAGLEVPYSEAAGTPGTFAVGAGIVLAGIAIGLMAGRRYVSKPLPAAGDGHVPAAQP
ncbi:MAG TPA: hypothetical protein VF062_03825 [Candidatus Limnocylindrales bacterium]